MVMIAALADLHGYLPKQVPDCDVFVIAGDVCLDIYGGRKGPQAQAMWLYDEFWPWARALPMPVVMTWGNHDWIGEPVHGYASLAENVHVVVDGSVTVAGVKFWCSPWTPPFFNWAFMRPEPELAELYETVPDDVDVMVTHGPPYMMCDRTLESKYAGSKALRDAVGRLQPQLLLCGHIHEARSEAGYGRTRVVNCSYVDAAYRPVNGFWIGDVEAKECTADARGSVLGS